MSSLSHVFRFQTSIEAVRAHHWRSITDAYSGCAFNCQYCLYKGPDDYGAHVRIVRGETAPDASLGILNIGSTTDPYQPIEGDMRLTRQSLQACLDERIPVFLLTRGTMVERDVDILTDLAAQGLLEICFSVITLNKDIAQHIEPRSPTPLERISVAERLARMGLPVTFHVAPLIPGLDSESDLASLGRTLGHISGRHVFCAVLGIQRGYWSSLQRAMEKASGDCDDYEAFSAAYPESIELSRSGAVVCELPKALPSLSALRMGVQESGATFVCENFPFLSTGALEDGIYRWKLPTVYDMASWISSQAKPVAWYQFEDWYQTFEPSDQLRSLVNQAWDSGELMLGTQLTRITGQGEVKYLYSPDHISDPAHTTLVTRREGL